MSLRKNFGRGGVAALVLAGAFVALPAMAADHRDGGAAQADPSSDINDVYAFMNGDNLVLGMTVNPFADADATFSDAVQFVWHVNTWAAFGSSLAPGAEPALETTVQCEFDAAQMIQCWIHRDGENLDYIMGDASSEEGVATASSQVFAGLRSDPFYFYLTGFNDARDAVISEVTAGNVDLSNGTLCPELTNGQLELLGDALTVSAGGQGLNDFLGANTLAIVIEVDKALFIDAENDVVSVHAATHAKP